MEAVQQKKDLRDAVVEALSAAAAAGEKVIVMVSDSTSTSKIGSFAAQYPDRLVNVGIAEQNLVGISAGLSLQGFVPVTMNAACFLVNRSNEQVKNDICYSNTNVKLIGLNAGVTYGPLASTHHSIDDLSIMKGFGNILIWAPSDAVEAGQMVRAALTTEGPVYIRLDNASFPILHDAGYRFVPGRCDVLVEGKDLTLCAIGSVVHEAVAAAAELKTAGVDAGVISVPSLRPLDRTALAALLAKTKKVITVEEHSVAGGLGSTVAEILAEGGIPSRLKRLGITEGKFAVSGPRDKIRAHYGIDKTGIVAAGLAKE
jgi:transketolase